MTWKNKLVNTSETNQMMAWDSMDAPESTARLIDDFVGSLNLAIQLSGSDVISGGTCLAFLLL